MPIPKEHDVGGWYIPDHAVLRFRERYGWDDESDYDIRLCIRDLLQCVGPGGVYEFYSDQNGQNMNIYHCIFDGVHSYFLVNPQQRPPAVISVFTLGQFKNFWDELPDNAQINGPEEEYDKDKWFIELQAKEREIKELRQKLKNEKLKSEEKTAILKNLNKILKDVIRFEDTVD